MGLYRSFLLIAASVSTAVADTPPTPPTPTPPPIPAPPTLPPTPNMPSMGTTDMPATGMPTGTSVDSVNATTTAEEEKQKKEPKAGDFNAGGQARFPSGPDELGQYAAFNWIAADLKARYYLLKTVTVDANAPLAVKKPDELMSGADPKMVGGMSITLDARLPVPKSKLIRYETDIGLALTAAYMRQGAMLLSERDFPLFTGGFEPGLAGGLVMKLKMSSVVDFSFIPTYVFQTGETENLTALQIPIALALKVGNAVKLSTDMGIYTGDDISLRPSNGGRIALGAALDLKIGKILAHAGAGFASLITSSVGAYPTIRDSIYVDLNVKWAK